MKVIYIHQYFRTRSMVGGTRSLEMARRLVDAGHEVHIVTSDTTGRRGRTWFETEESGIHVHWLPVAYRNEMRFRRRLIAFAWFMVAATRKAMQLGGDIVFATSTPLTIAVPGVLAARYNRIPFVFEIRDLWPEVPIAIGALRNPLLIAASRWLEHWAYRHARHVVALSPTMREAVLGHGMAEDRVTVIPNGCDFDLFDAPCSAGESFRRRHAWLGDRPLILYAGTLGFINGVDYMVRMAAAARQIDPDVRFLIVGSGNQSDLVRSEAQRLQVLDRNLFIMETVSKEEMPAVLSAADLATSFVRPLKVLRADAANKVFDALAARRPVAINHGGYLADLIRERDCGLVLPEEDAEAAARQVVTAVRTPGWSAAAGERAYALGREAFGRDELAARLERVLLEAVGADGSQPLARRRLPSAA